MNRKRKDNPRLCISHVPLILLMLCLYVKGGFVVFFFSFFSIIFFVFPMLQQKHVLCNERNVLSMRLELYKYIEYHCICESDEFSHGSWKPNDKKSCGTLEILTVGILKSLK